MIIVYPTIIRRYGNDDDPNIVVTLVSRRRSIST